MKYEKTWVITKGQMNEVVEGVKKMKNIRKLTKKALDSVYKNDKNKKWYQFWK